MTDGATNGWLGRRAAQIAAAAGPLLLFLRQPAPVFWTACFLVLVAAGLTAWLAVLAPIPVFSVAALAGLAILARRMGWRLPFAPHRAAKDGPAAPKAALRGDAGAIALFGPEMTLEGHLQGAEETLIRGRFSGEIQSGRLVVDADAIVEADVQAETVEVFGQLDGRVRCDTIRVLSGAVLKGRLTQRLVLVAPGARFEVTATSSQAKRRTTTKFKQAVRRLQG